MNRVARFSIASLLVGALATTALNWMAAWDEMYPSPLGIHLRLVGGDFDRTPGAGDFFKGDERLVIPAWYAMIPREWQVGPRVWHQHDYSSLASTHTEILGECTDATGLQRLVTWRPGLGLSDAFSVKTFLSVPSPLEGPDDGKRPSQCYLFYYFSPAPPESSVPHMLEAHGIPKNISFRSHADWEHLQLPSWAVATGDCPTNLVSFENQPIAVPPGGSPRADSYACGATTEEIRVYGWPLRNMIVRGWRRDLTWFGESSSDPRPTRESSQWTSDGLLDVAPIWWAVGAQLMLPATGLPWKPLWLPFFANSLILGVPLTLAGDGLFRGARWWIVQRRRTDRCRRCGYSRTGLAAHTPCPECGKHVP